MQNPFKAGVKTTEALFTEAQLAAMDAAQREWDDIVYADEAHTRPQPGHTIEPELSAFVDRIQIERPACSCGWRGEWRCSQRAAPQRRSVDPGWMNENYAADPKIEATVKKYAEKLKPVSTRRITKADFDALPVEVLSPDDADVAPESWTGWTPGRIAKVAAEAAARVLKGTDGTDTSE